MRFQRVLSHPNYDAYDQVEWRRIDARIEGAKFEMLGVEVPVDWSENATNILAQKYLRKAGVPDRTWHPLPRSDVDEINMPIWLRPSAPGDEETLRYNESSETSAHQVFHRMAGCWTYWGWRVGLFRQRDGTTNAEEQARIFYDEIYLCLARQLAAPNSPQWFNTGLHWAYGIEGPDSGQWFIDDVAMRGQMATVSDAVRILNAYQRPQPHACFLTPAEDNLVGPNGIMDTWMREARIFKFGSGSGINASRWRAKGEKLSSGGVASGVMSWLRIGDSSAGAIQSGGTTRRAAKMVCLDVDHPEIEAFIDWKVREEAKAASMYVGSKYIESMYGENGHAYVHGYKGEDVPQAVKDRIAAGFPAEVFGIGWEEEAISSVDGQNSNNSVRVTDEFLRRAREGAYWGEDDWDLTARTDGSVMKTVRAGALMDKICRAAWASADPGLLFHDTINNWNTCAADGEIRTTNPCFTGDTLVVTESGDIPISRLVQMKRDGEQLPKALSWDRESQKIVTRPILNAWKSGVAATICLVKTTAGNFRCTPDHIWITWEEAQVRAQDLHPSTRLLSATHDEVFFYEVVAVEKAVLAEGVDVFDIEVEETHNFGIRRVPGSYPIFVHNCAEYQFLDDTACFAGETLVWTINGPRRFDELARSGKSVPVLTELPDGTLAYRDMISPRKTKHCVELVQITFKARGARGRKNSFTTVRVTPDHIFYLRSGGEKRADELLADDRIKSAYRSSAGDNYATIYNTGGDFVGDHILSAEYKYGRRPGAGEHVHHINLNKWDNDPSNIVVKTETDHIGDHSRDWFANATPEMLEQRSSKIRSKLAGRPLSKEHRAKLSASHIGLIRSPEAIAATVAKVRGQKRTDEQRARISAAKLANPSNTKGLFWITDGFSSRKLRRGETVPDGWRLGRTGRTRASLPANHTIVSVERLVEKEDVYCGAVPATNRFFISLGHDHREGVLVHNCNLASMRLTKFLRDDSTIDVDLFTHVTRLWTVVLDISISMASFPAAGYAVGTHNYRTLGLGYADLGGLLMSTALPYDSDEGRALAAALTALMTGVAYRTSAELAEELGAFPRWEANESSFRHVLRRHQAAVGNVRCVGTADAVVVAALRHWEEVCNAKAFRNAQVTLIAPTGTISFVMDCATTGVEPEQALVKYKHLAGGGQMKIANPLVPVALDRLKCSGYRSETIVRYVAETGTVEGSKLPEEYLPIFDCCVPLREGGRFLRPEAHVLMVAAVQPFLSGAVSKTTNMPRSATVDDVRRIYLMAHEHGLKAIAIYRDGSKLTQPLNVDRKEVVPDKPDGRVHSGQHNAKPPSSEAGAVFGTSNDGRVGTVFTERRDQLLRAFDPSTSATSAAGRSTHEYLPWRRERGYTQKAKIDGQTLFWRVSEYPDGRPGEIFIELAHEGSTLRATANCVAIGISVALQHGTPLEALVDKYLNTKFEPAGYVEGHDRIRFATSFADLIARDLAITYLGREELANVVRPATTTEMAASVVALDRRAVETAQGAVVTGDHCRECGGLLRQTGTCKTCPDCGWNEGCG